MRDVQVAGKCVLLRADLNEPISQNGQVADDFRLRRALPTIEYLSTQGARTVIIAHLGREGATLAPIAKAMGALTSVPITFCDKPLADSGEMIEALKPGECLLLENIRKEEGEEQNDPALAALLASFGDLYVNDAFADSHRQHASIVGIPKLLPSYAGLLMEKEVAHASEALNPPMGSLALIGGAKFETKEPLIRALLQKYATVCIGGALGNDLLKARGVNIGASTTSGMAVPEDLTSEARLLAPTDTLAKEGHIMDIGAATAERWSALVASTPFVLWNGPMGVCEQGFTQGTRALAQAIATSGARAEIGGGDTIAAMRELNLPLNPAKVFLSTGGGALLQLIAEGTLPGIEALRT